MTCVICGNGDTKAGHATVTLTRRGTTVVVKRVPAQICENCGEEYVDDGTTLRLLSLAEEASPAAVEVTVREYVAA